MYVNRCITALLNLGSSISLSEKLEPESEPEAVWASKVILLMDISYSVFKTLPGEVSLCLGQSGIPYKLHHGIPIILCGICAPEEGRTVKWLLHVACPEIQQLNYLLFCKKIIVNLLILLYEKNFLLKPARNSDVMRVLEVLWWLSVHCGGLWEVLRTWWLIPVGKWQVEMFQMSHHVNKKS